jgi:predicted unusual protein kinase regulating ubiquinone biosynthesis (AarF/ABC1/UbiB family)
VLLFFSRALGSILLWDIALRRLGFARQVRRGRAARFQAIARRFRKLAGELGGVWIKVGQFLSARVDVLPESVTQELADLQDEVDPEPLSAMLSVAQSEFDGDLEAHFPWLEPSPLASASLGQVHRARLPTGQDVVVKIQRPGIHQLIEVDLAALKTVISWLKRYKPITRRADLDALYEEFSSTLWEEVDYVAEAKNARHFADMFSGDERVRIPDVHGTHSTERVLTLEDVYFIKITDYAAIEAAGVDREEVASRLLDTYLHQIFRRGFFHADPHPGNLFVEPLEDGEWRLVFVDFGMVGELTQKNWEGLRQLVIAVGTQDVDRVIRAYQQLDMLLPTADLGRLRQVEGAFIERFWGKSMRELREIHPQEMRAIAQEYRDVLYEMPFQLPSNLIFLGRCVAILSGMCTGLDPDFNLFAHLVPFAQELLAEERGEWLDELLDWLIEQGEALLTMPARMDSVLTQLERGEIVVAARPGPEFQQDLARLTGAVRGLAGAVLTSALLITGALLYLNGELLLGAIAAALALITLGWILLR